MRADQLMIGDWVKTNDLYKAIKDVKVRAISQYSVQDETTSQWIDCQHIQPIPLTKDILEKNGFVEDRKIKCYTYEEEKTLKRLIQNFTHFGDFDCHIVSKNFDADMRLSYVHELQHALKLCGIDKQIIL